MNRRRFVQSASLGAAGFLLSSVVLRGQDDATWAESQVIPQTAWGRVWIRWTEPALPAETLPVYGLVIPWGAAPALMESARTQGYRAYAAVRPEQASEAANSSRALGLSGIVLESGDAERAKDEKTAGDLRLAYPNLTVLSSDPSSRQPAMMGSTVITRSGVMQISSPTEQPWIDSNIAMVGFDRAFRPAQTPLIDFQWQLPDALQQQLGPSIENYCLAVAEAGALHSDLILNLPRSLEKALVSGSDDAWTVWKRVAKYAEFYQKEGERPVALQANVGVVTDAYESSYETINLMARHNIPFRVLTPGQLTLQNLESLDLIVAFAQPDEAAIRLVGRFVENGGVAILVSLHCPFPWSSSVGRRVSSDSVSYTIGKGKIIELPEGVADPGMFPAMFDGSWANKICLSRSGMRPPPSRCLTSSPEPPLLPRNS